MTKPYEEDLAEAPPYTVKEAIVQRRYMPNSMQEARLVKTAMAAEELEKVYDELGLKDGDRSVGGVKGYVTVQRNAIKLQKEKVAELEAEMDAMGEMRMGDDA